jgi:uncharacterized protein (DUF2336 family)
MHGGKAPGAPLGNSNARRHGQYSAEAIAQRNARRHGQYSAEAIAQRRKLAELLRDIKGLVEQVEGKE